MASHALPSVGPDNKHKAETLELSQGRPSASPETKGPMREEEEAPKGVEGCGVWSIGPAFSDEAKVRAGLDRLGPFLLESYSSPLELIKRGRGLFDSDGADGDEQEGRDDEGASTPLSGLQELQLNDVVDDVSDPDRSVSSESESIEEVSDRLFESRVADGEIEEVGQPQSKRKRTAFEAGRRDNFVKHDFRRKKKRFPRKQMKRHKKLHEKDPDHKYKARQERVF